MLRYIAGRLLQAIPVVVLSSIVTFGMLRLIPGDAAEVLAGSNATPEAIEAVRIANGLDQPLPAQYVVWLGKVVRGDLGVSFFTKRPVSELLAQRIPATLELALAALLLVLLISIPAGVLAAVNQRQPIDWFISALSGTIIAVPGFWLGLLAIMLFALVLGWLPPGGRADFGRDPALALKSLLLPAVTLALPPAAGLVRLVRSAVLETLHEDYVRTGRAKGLGEAPLLWRHVLRNALVPVITIIGLQFGALLGGAVVTEAVFSWPGVGSLIRDALAGRDYVVVQSCLLLLVLLFIVMNLATDLAYGVLDPRIRLTGRAPR